MHIIIKHYINGKYELTIITYIEQKHEPVTQLNNYALKLSASGKTWKIYFQLFLDGC